MDSAANPRKWAGQRAEHMQNTLLMSHEETVRQQVLYRPIKTSRFLSGFATGGDALIVHRPDVSPFPYWSYFVILSLHISA
jgi:hypothetical protein